MKKASNSCSKNLICHALRANQRAALVDRRQWSKMLLLARGPSPAAGALDNKEGNCPSRNVSVVPWPQSADHVGRSRPKQSVAKPAERLVRGPCSWFGPCEQIAHRAVVPFPAPPR